jgi:hypothetical protein
MLRPSKGGLPEIKFVPTGCARFIVDGATPAKESTATAQDEGAWDTPVLLQGRLSGTLGHEEDATVKAMAAALDARRKRQLHHNNNCATGAVFGVASVFPNTFQERVRPSACPRMQRPASVRRPWPRGAMRLMPNRLNLRVYSRPFGTCLLAQLASLPRPPGVHNAAWRRYGGVAARPCRSASIKQVTISGVLCGSSQESDNQEPEHDRQGSQESENQKSQHPGVASRECGTAISHGSANNDLLLRKSLKPSKEDFQQVAAYARSGHHGK